ncbi:hypothetical protein KI387_028308, partial [Taxus chinensis]
CCVVGCSSTIISQKTACGKAVLGQNVGSPDVDGDSASGHGHSPDGVFDFGGLLASPAIGSGSPNPYSSTLNDGIYGVVSGSPVLTNGFSLLGSGDGGLLLGVYDGLGPSHGDHPIAPAKPISSKHSYDVATKHHQGTKLLQPAKKSPMVTFETQ